MGIAVSVVSAILKAIVGDKAGSGLMKEIADISIVGVSEKGVNEITDFLNGEKSKIEHILSKENMKSMKIPEENIDYVAAEIKDMFSKFDITDEVLKQCRYDSMNLSAFLWNKYRECKNDYIECESDIKECLFAVAKALIEIVRESEKFEKEVLIQISNSIDDNNAAVQKISEYMKENFSKLDSNSQMALNILWMILEQIQQMNMQGNEVKNIIVENKKFQNNKKQDYIKNWNSRLFLHQDNDEKPITLADAFIMPDYRMHKSIKGIGFSAKDTLDKIIKKFVNYDRTSTMLITGVPGMGKSSITSWIANEYKDDDRVIVLRFRDWKKDVLEETLLEAICDKLDSEEEDLDNKVLILDGFDEMKALNIRDTLLNTLFNDIKDFENFKCIITSRAAYVDSSQFHNVLELKEFDIERVETFVKIITGDALNGRAKIESNLEVLGIPVILYMAVMSNIDIGENPTKPELYNRIFAEKGGIFDRFYDGDVGYDEGKQILRSAGNIKKYLDFLQKVAFNMFEKGELSLMEDELSLGEDECHVPELEFEKSLVSIMEFPIKHLFENTAFNIEFIHKSIYEYFVAEYMYIKIREGINVSKEKLAGALGKLFKKSMLSEEIIEFLKYKIKNDKLNSAFYLMNEVFQLMLQNGMTYYTDKNYADIMKCELRVFANMLEFMHIWKGKIGLSNLDYLKYNIEYELNLREMDLSNVNLRGVDLRKADLRNANLERTIFRRADLRGADLQGAILIGTDLRGADIRNVIIDGAVLERIDLRGAILDEIQVNGLKEKCNVCEVKVCIKDIEKIVSYDGYLNRGRNWC